MKADNPMKRPEVRARQAETLKQSYASGKHVPFMSTPRGRKIMSETARAKQSGPNNPMKDPEVARRMGETRRLRHSAKISVYMTANNPMRSAAAREKARVALNDPQTRMRYEAAIKLFEEKHPNGFESRVLAFLLENNLPFRFVGDGSLWVGPCLSGTSRNPDFVHTSRPRVILAHGKYWHQDAEKVERELMDYAGKGWACFTIWDSDALNSALAERLREFAGAG
jgi:G:T-mismatch repair DNA endonuclease (very short patch repair protein)